MEKQASIPPGLPRPNPTLSYWQDPPDPTISDHRSTADLPQHADYVVIGSGISGSCVAFNLLNEEGFGKSGSSIDIVMLEAREACSGATGRNGGHTKGASYRTFLHNHETLGEHEAVKIAQFEYDCMRAVHAFARDYGIDCDSRELETVDVIYDQAQWDQSIEAIGLMRRVMGRNCPASLYTVHTPEETVERYLAAGAIGSISYAAGGLSAYKFVIGVLKLCLEKGLNLQTNTPAMSVAYDGSRWRVHTPRGSIDTARVVLACNGYTATIYSRLQGTICPLRGQVTAHRPGAAMVKTGLANTYSLIYKEGYEYMIFRPPGSKFAGDIVIGGGLTKTAHEGLYEYGNTDDTSLNPDISKYLYGTTSRYFGSHWGEDDKDGRIRKEWTGIMGYSSDGHPHVGKISGEEGLFISASFQGHGMVLCFLCSRALSEMLMGRDGPELDRWFPRKFRFDEKRLCIPFRGKVSHVPVKREKL